MAITNTKPAHGFNLKTSPPIFILPTHLQTEELRQAEDLVFQLEGKLTYDAKDARLFLGKVGQKKRAAFDLRAREVWTEEAVLPVRTAADHSGPGSSKEPARKRRRISPGAETKRTLRRLTSTSSSTATEDGVTDADDDDAAERSDINWPDLTNSIIVLKLSWLDECVKQDTLVPFTPYSVYTAKIIPKPLLETAPQALPREGITYIRATPEHSSPIASASSSPVMSRVGTSSTILERARLEAEATGQTQKSGSSQVAYPTRRRFGDHARRHQYQKSSTSPTSPRSQRPKLHRETTSEMEELAEHPIPPLPVWATGPHATYACCRSTPMDPPNAAFIAQLTKIKDARLLTLDEIGVRAYSTSIASVAAYPHVIQHHSELTRLPGCNEKIAMLWSEWYHSTDEEDEDDPTPRTRHIQTVQQLAADPDLQILDLFWNIWGVGPDTARKFYFEHGWRDLDDVVEFGWHALSRVQQIGVKYYDEFLVKIPRDEVERIRDVVLRHARLVLGIGEADYDTPRDVECIIVGGYRRGKALCGDVDVILSHRDEAKTLDLVVDVVRSLEADAYVTHTLSLHTTTSDRGQATLPFRAQGHSGHGFDSLDKALCVWQDPVFEADSSPEEEEEEEGKGNAKKNSNIHRRVDIIVSTWRTVGCAVLGWSGGTTFQRDIRRFVSKVHGWKFDSSGVRDRKSGRVLDLEAPREVEVDGGQKIWDDGDTWMDRERRLMEGLGIGFRPATERCTG